MLYQPLKTKKKMRKKVPRFNNTYFKIGLSLIILISLSTTTLFSQGTCSTSAALPANGRQLAISFVLNGKGYCGTGWDTGYNNDFFV